MKRAKVSNVELVETYTDGWGSHCFVLIDGHTIIDITATQFVGHVDKVLAYDTRLVNNWNRLCPFYWTIEKRFTSIHDLKMYQKTTGWPAEQTAR